MVEIRKETGIGFGRADFLYKGNKKRICNKSKSEDSRISDLKTDLGNELM